MQMPGDVPGGMVRVGIERDISLHQETARKKFGSYKDKLKSKQFQNSACRKNLIFLFLFLK